MLFIFLETLLKSNEENSTKIPMHIKTVPIFKYPFLKDSPVHLKVPHCSVQKISREVLHQVQNKPENAHYCTKGLRLHEIRQL